ncbi:Peptidyl-prolyl cis-trans isomerase FKBP65 [Acorus calamus]|uniref:peptidylprolyl isomerase n=1 Tax=Acorus calamus TaxID=4465 RepID=A0AAV9CSJ2_ACOCL|nr:Peptidyl-prolyl cis-trans isomerase FKBP65 [Acorus calamus]
MQPQRLIEVSLNSTSNKVINFNISQTLRTIGQRKTDDDDEEEPGEVIESAPPLRVGEEREIGGLKKKLIKRGKGWETPELGDEVTAHYVGTLLDGSVFSSTRDGGAPLTFKLGQGQVVVGLDQGIITMKKGEIALFTIPSKLGYGINGANGAPPDSDLRFEVELISWLTVTDICKDGKIIKTIFSRGEGDMQPGDLDEVTVKYQVRLPDGLVVAETPDEGFEFYVEDGHLCPALPKALKTMRKGEKAFLAVKPSYAFGEHGKDANNGFPAIPSNATLNMDLELVSFKSVVDISGDMMVIKKILREGEGIRYPKEGSTVHVKYTAKLEDGTVFERKGFKENEAFQFIIDEEQVIKGLDLAVMTMKKGELSVVTIRPAYGYGDQEVVRDLAIVPSCSTLTYEVETVDFTKEKELWEMSNGEKIEAATKAKEDGNNLFKIGKYQQQQKNMTRSFEDGEEKLVKNLRVAFLQHVNNSQVLDIETSNVKALYRRAQAYINTADLDLAEYDIKVALEVDPENREVKTIYRTLKQLQAESNKKDAKLYTNMFAQMTKETDTALKKMLDLVKKMQYDSSPQIEETMLPDLFFCPHYSTKLTTCNSTATSAAVFLPYYTALDSLRFLYGSDLNSSIVSVTIVVSMDRIGEGRWWD